MTQPQAILDYASPGRAGRFRVGSTSVIDVYDRGDRVQIIERLENRGTAAVLIGVDLLIIAFMFYSDGRSINRFLARGDVGVSLVFSVIVASIMLGLLFFAVLHNWASTRVEADSESLTLTFANPVRQKRFSLKRISIHSIEVDTLTRDNELRILGSHHDLRLFTAHPLLELIRIADLLVRVLNLRDTQTQDIPYASVHEGYPH